MKKIITLLFFVGFLTSAFAQSHQRGGSGNTSNKDQSSWQHQSGSSSHSNDYAYNKDHGNRGGSWRDRDDHHGYRDHDNRGHNGYGRYERDHRRGSWFRVFHSRHWH